MYQDSVQNLYSTLKLNYNITPDSSVESIFQTRIRLNMTPKSE